MAYRTMNRAQLYREYTRSEPCPKCNAPAGAPCADFRSYDGECRNMHRERYELVRALHP